MAARRWLWAATVTGCVALAALIARADDVFTRRIAPLARAEKPSSCRECHVAGVDLGQYILDTEAATFAALREAGLIDVEAPERSRLLQFIARAPEHEDPAVKQVRAEELAAFREWITSAVRRPELLSAKPTGKAVGPAWDAEVIRHARQDRVLQSFMENIWIERERCAGCHSPDKNRRLVAKHGEQISWISPEDPAGTLALCVDHGLFDLDEPDHSLILQKPLGEVEHGGHVKFVRGSRTDKQFRAFLEDYAAVARGTYRSADDLPAPTERVVLATGQQLRMTGFPRDCADCLVRIDLHAATGGGWSAAPVGVVDGRVNPQNGQMQNMVFALMPRDAVTTRELLERRLLPGGRYLARVFVDRRGRVARDRDAELGPDDLLGEVEFDGPWPPGYQPPKVVQAPHSRR